MRQNLGWTAPPGFNDPIPNIDYSYYQRGSDDGQDWEDGSDDAVSKVWQGSVDSQNHYSCCHRCSDDGRDWEEGSDDMVSEVWGTSVCLSRGMEVLKSLGGN